MKNNKKEMSSATKNTQGKVLPQTKFLLEKVTRKVNSFKEVHIAVGCIMLLVIVSLSFTTVVAINVEATEAKQMLTPQSVILQPVNVVEEKDSDGDGYRDSVDACIDVAPINNDGKGCEAIIDLDGDGYIDINDACPKLAPINDDGTGCEAEIIYPVTDYSANLIHASNTDMSYMDVSLSGNAVRYSNGYYCGGDNIAYEQGTDAILVAMGAQYDYGQYYEVEISNYGTVIVKKVEEKGSTLNNEGYIGMTGDSIELLVCDGFDSTGAGKSSNLGMYINAIYKASY